jgi:hypothetical protein
VCRDCIVFYLAELLIAQKTSPALVHDFLASLVGEPAVEELMARAGSLISKATIKNAKATTLGLKPYCACEAQIGVTKWTPRSKR